MGFLETFSSLWLHFFSVHLVIVCRLGTVTLAGGLWGEFLCIWRRHKAGERWGCPSPSLRIQKGLLPSQTMWGSHIPAPEGWTRRDSQSFSCSSLMCERKWGRNTDQDFDSLILWSLGLMTARNHGFGNNFTHFDKFLSFARLQEDPFSKSGAK